MLKHLRYFSIFAFAILLLAQPITTFAALEPKAAAAPKPKAAEGPTSNLVDTKWLSENLKDPNLVLLDASSACPKEHIAGATCVNIYELLSFGTAAKPLAELEDS